MKKTIVILTLITFIFLCGCNEQQAETSLHTSKAPSASGTLQSESLPAILDEDPPQISGLKYTEENGTDISYPCIMADFDCTSINNALFECCVKAFINEGSSSSPVGTYQITYFSEEAISFTMKINGYEKDGKIKDEGLFAFCFNIKTAAKESITDYIAFNGKNKDLITSEYKKKYHAEPPAFAEDIPFYIIDKSELGIVFNENEFVEIPINSFS